MPLRLCIHEHFGLVANCNLIEHLLNCAPCKYILEPLVILMLKLKSFVDDISRSVWLLLFMYQVLSSYNMFISMHKYMISSLCQV